MSPRRRSPRTLVVLAAGLVVAAAPLLLRPSTALAGGFLEVLDVTGGRPGPVPGTVIAEPTPLRWADTCLPPPHRINDAVDPLPNPLGEDFLAVADAARVFAAAMERWNRIPTAYAELALAGTTTNPGSRGLDFVHEITFLAPDDFDVIASSPSVAFAADVTLVDGDDVDGDGDPDVAAGLVRCADADGDGDTELVPGFYPAGTIVDNDVVLNTRTDVGYRFTADDGAVDDHPRSVDLEAVAVHELGHSLGLAHVLDDQLGDGDGTAVTMFPFTDTGDPDAERAQRTLAGDDVAWASLHYPEGTATGGPAALTGSDVPFDAVYGLIEGEVEEGATGLPVAGASIAARAWDGGRHGDGSLPALAASAYSGAVRLLVDAATGAALLTGDPGFHLVHGRFRIPVPSGLYRLEMEAADGAPVAAGRVSFTVLVGALLGQQGFDEERWNGPLEGAAESRPGDARPVPVRAGRVRDGHRLVTERWRREQPHGSRDGVGFSAARGGSWYAVAFPAAEVAARIEAGEVPVAGLFRTLVGDRSAPVRFAQAALVTGRVEPGGRAVLDLDRPLRRAAPFIAQDDDFAPFYLAHPADLARRIERLAAGDGQLFLALQLPEEPFPGPSGRPPLLGLDGPAAGNDVPILGRSYFSSDGATFVPDGRFNYMMSLAFSTAGGP